MRSEVDGILVATHDLKAPLTLMRQLALSLSFASAPEERTEIEQQLIDVSSRAIEQVNDLSRVARLEDGLFVLEPVSVRGVCEEVTRELAPLFAAEDRELGTAFKNRCRLAVANRDLLRSIITNFCTNALRYSDPDSRSCLTVSDSKGKIRIGVRDFGPALPVSVWQSLSRGGLNRPTAIAMRPGSSGLGLYIASEFARHMHATIGAVRHRDGTSFYLDLPVSTQVSFF